jgi:hypothetical protein
MLTEFIRVFNRKVNVMTDKSIANAEKSGILLNNFDYIYVAQKFPFNNLFLKMDALNAVTLTLGIEYWDGTEWVDAVDVIDFTKGLKQSGLIQFSLNRDDSWQEVQYSDAQASSCPDELKGLNISDCYWIRIAPSVAPTGTTSIESVGYAFTTTETVNGIDTNAPLYYETFSASKADWLEEILIASQMMISEMKSAGLLKAQGQIISLDDFYIPCARRTLLHIYSQMGKAYEGKRGEESALYKKFMGGPKSIDADQNARAEKAETLSTITRLVR